MDNLDTLCPVGRQAWPGQHREELLNIAVRQGPWMDMQGLNTSLLGPRVEARSPINYLIRLDKCSRIVKCDSEPRRHELMGASLLSRSCANFAVYSAHQNHPIMSDYGNQATVTELGSFLWNLPERLRSAYVAATMPSTLCLFRAREIGPSG